MPCLRALGSKGNAERADRTGESDGSLGVRIRETLRAIDPLKKVRYYLGGLGFELGVAGSGCRAEGCFLLLRAPAFLGLGFRDKRYRMKL